MGYYTRYKLCAFESQPTLFGNNTEIDVSLFGADLPGYGYALDDDGSTYDSVKWYDYHEEMLAFSKKHPDVIFQLRGEGEESGDMWCTYYNNGKSVHHVAPDWTPPPFDASQLT